MKALLRRWMLRKRTYIFILMMVLLQFVSSCLQFRISDKQVKREFRNQKIKPTFHKEPTSDERTLHYAQIGNDSLPTLFFIHGSPGDWSAYLAFFKDSLLLSESQLVAIDRMGYGKSSFGKGEKSLQKQVEFYKTILEKYQSPQKPILIGHSYAGAVVAQLAMDYPDLMSGVVILAGVADPELQKPRWYNLAAKQWWVWSWLPRSLKVSNREMVQLEEDLEAIEDKWSQITVPAIVVHGTKDILVDYETTKFLEQKLTHTDLEIITLKDVDHFIPWTHCDTVRHTILKMREKVHANK